MTASRYKFPKSSLRLAGFNLADFFKEDENGEGTGSFEGFLPGFKETTLTKGRGGVMSYKAPKAPTRVSEFTLTPEEMAPGGGVNISNMNQQTVAPEPPAPPAPEPVQISSKWGADPAYFGHEDYFRNIEAGATPSQIMDFLDENINLLRMGNVPGGGGLYDQLKAGNVPTLGSSGREVVEQQQAAQPSPPSQTASAPSGPSFSTQYGASSEFLGHKDVEAAKAGGMTNEQIAQVLKANVGKLRMGNLPGGGGLYDEYAQYM